MSAITILGGVGPLTMSTREVADLLGKQHSNIKISAERLAASGVIGTLAAQEFAHNGNTYTEYRLGKRDCLILVAQNCPEFTAKIVDRWQELEAANQGAVLPDFTDPAAAAIAWAEQYRERQALQSANETQAKELAITGPKAAALDMISASEEDLTITQAAKVLGVKIATLTNWMSANGWVYRQNGSWVAYQQQIENGRLRYKEANYTDQKTEQSCIRPYCHVTPKGLAKLAVVFGGGRQAA